MTKKMEKIIKEYESRLNVAVFLYEKGIVDYDTAKKELREEEKMFYDMRTAMYFYHLISEADFDATCHIASDLKYAAFDKLLNTNFPTTA